MKLISKACTPVQRGRGGGVESPATGEEGGCKSCVGLIDVVGALLITEGG